MAQSQSRKRKLVEQIESYLAEELSGLAKSGGDGSREAEIQQLLLMYRFLPMRDFSAEDVICPAALVELELNGVKALYFVVPRGGGLITQFEGKAVQVITPHSPMGEALMGRKVGDTVPVFLRDGARHYRVVSIS